MIWLFIKLVLKIKIKHSELKYYLKEANEKAPKDELEEYCKGELLFTRIVYYLSTSKITVFRYDF